MKRYRSLASGMLALLAAAMPLRAQVITEVIGTGPDSSYLVLEAVDFGAPLIYEYRYDFSLTGAFDAYALLTSIDVAVTDLSFTFVNYGDVDSPNFFLDSVTFGLTTLTNTPFPDIGPYWAQSVSGGQAGYPAAGPVAEGAWTFGSGISAPYRIVEPGSWDGFTFNEDGDPPSVAPIPEPQSAGLLAAGLAVLAWTAFKRRENSCIQPH